MADQPCPICDIPHDGAVTRLPAALYAGLVAVLAQPPAPAPIYPKPRRKGSRRPTLPVGPSAPGTLRRDVADYLAEHYTPRDVVPHATAGLLATAFYAHPDSVTHAIRRAGYRLATKREAL